LLCLLTETARKSLTKSIVFTSRKKEPLIKIP